MAFLQVNLQYKNLEVVNMTGYNGNISMELNGNMSDINILHTELEKWGLDVKIEKRKLDKLIIEDLK